MSDFLTVFCKFPFFSDIRILYQDEICLAMDSKKYYIIEYKTVQGGTNMQINKDMLIGDLVRLDDGIAPILMGAGMHCLG